MGKKPFWLSFALALAVALCPMAALAEQATGLELATTQTTALVSDSDTGPEPEPEPEPIGWVKYQGYWYYLDANGKVVTSDFASYGEYVFYLQSNGRVYTTPGWLKVGGKYYCVSSSGALYRNAWLKYNGYWYYVGDDCAVVVSGWVVNGDKYYYMNASGNMTHGWAVIDGTYYYFGDDGLLYYSRYTPDGYYMGADGTWDESMPLKTYAWSGGYYTWEEVSGVSRTSLVSYLTNNWKRYYGTPYSSSPCSIPGVGMHCAGFVARVLYDMGVSDRFYTKSASYSVESRNLGYLYKSNISSYTNENVWRVRGWLVWADTHYVRWLGYESYEALLRGAQAGDFKKGDIVIVAGNASYIKNNVTMSHICFYCGDESNWARIWESNPYGNGIYSQSYYTGRFIVLTSVRAAG